MPPLFLSFLLIVISSSSIAAEAAEAAAESPPHSCSADYQHHNQDNHHPCPPFPSPPTTFPFAVSPGCNHPSFQIHCSAPHSLLSIDSSPFLLLSHSHPNSLTLTPLLIPNPKCPSLPSRPINLSSSPFRLFPDPCPVLSCKNLHHHPPNSFCNLSPWQLELLSKPFLLFDACSSDPRARRNCSSDPLPQFLHLGFRVEWDLAADPYNASCSACRASANGVCGFNESSSSRPFLCFPSLDTLNQPSHSSAARRLLVLASALLAAAACVSLVLVALWAVRRRWGSKRERGDPMSSFLRRHQIHPPVFTYEQLRSSTNGFDSRRKIGDGGFGSVFLAQLDDGRVAAVKRLHRQHPVASTKSFCNEILILSSLRHHSLVRLHGYCCDPRGLLLVYDYVPNGTLADHLHGSRSSHRKGSLTWPVRVDVALQTASALEYLHFSLKPPVVHRDITSNNIFVERDMRIKVGDFGLSRLLSLPDPSSAAAAGSPSEYVCCTGPQGTPGYLDPEYHRSFRLTEKSDVYSFGVVLLELVTGMKAVDLRRDRREVSLADLVVSRIQVGALHEVVDPVLVRQGEAMITIEAVAELAFRCVAGDKDDRPNARELVEELRRIRGLVQDSARAKDNGSLLVWWVVSDGYGCYI